MALGRTAKYYRDNPEARKKRLDYQKDYNKKNVKYRQRLNKFNRKKGTYGNGDGLDACHKEVNGKIKIVLCRMKKNRADKKQKKQQSNG